MKAERRSEAGAALGACTSGLAMTGLFSLVINLLMLVRSMTAY